MGYQPTGDEIWLPAYVVGLTATRTIPPVPPATEPTTAPIEVPISADGAAEYTEEIDQFDTVISADDCFGVGSRTRRIRFGVAVKKDNPVNLRIGELLSVKWNDTVESHDGKCRVIRKSKPRGGGKGGLVYQYEARYTGPVATAAGTGTYVDPGDPPTGGGD